ncbi:hypothetical protein H634G_00170 [Metarhizium anisopliae BRIP 53293]|uniref:Uncharacterized protein n=1 Tax=Metarhizium anisopliae BRIP 53293 TaxID=1291518 RepID=A0A0D9PEH8_METAN|nr:hypothetical protein H634G_00170 [Metarhizium anisopliae BRIP 53293]KJK90367.1 hypothetical protein H633G_05776 [Metarhizium anisopliae BRIP 53284]
MPFGRRTHHHTTTTTTTRPPRRGLFSRRPRHAHHQKRKPTMKDKVSGAFTKLRGSLTRRPGLKAAGARRMHGTDGRGGHKHGYVF